MRKIPTLAVVAACLFSASAHANVTPGQLRCTISGGFAVVYSAHAINCVYYRPDGNAEFYVGSSERIGVDLGGTNARRVVFTVLVKEPTPPAVLEGEFVGVGGGITVGTGLAADGLVNNRGATLIPAPHYETFTGIDANAGLGVLRLRYAGSESRRVRERY